MTSKTTGTGAAWDAVERERRLDRLVRRICVAAWTATFILMLGYGFLVGRQVLHTMRLQEVGLATTEAVYAAAVPLGLALGVLALLAAALSTVGVFLRFRTAALAEIQVRLAALEGMLTAPPAP